MTPRILAQAVAVTVLLSGAGCAPGRNLQRVAEYRPETYRLGVGDQIRVIVFGEDQLSGQYRIDDQGRVALPLLGSVKSAGLSSSELETAVATGLRRRNLLRDPNVAIEVLNYRPVFVLGEVTRPGEYPYRPGMTMLTSVAIAGGFTYRAVEEYAAVVRTDGNTAHEALLTPSSLLSPGDVVKVYERRF